MPVWLSEGVAEWVSVAPLAPEDRALSTASLVAARDGLDGAEGVGTGSSLDLPPSDGFNGATSGANYGLSWWACEALTTAYGDEVLWTLVDDLDAAAEVVAARGEDPAAGVDERGAEVLAQRTGLRTEDLARRAARLMVATYGP